jgi:Ca-activated chloride channel family protein
MKKRTLLDLGLLLSLGVAGIGCSAGATPGGAQDDDLANTQVDHGQVPKASSFTVEGLLNEYDLPLESSICSKPLCINAGYGVSPLLTENRSALFVQIGFSSGIDETTFKRSPLNLSVVVDRSGSMIQAGKMDAVKAALSHLIDNLGEADRLSIVMFDDKVDVLAEPTLVTNRAAIKAAVSRISPRNATDMASGLRKGSDLVRLNAGQAGISDRIIVFTDALTNTGDTDQSSFIQIAASNAAQNIGITLFGVGTDLNQDLALAISQMRGGNYVFLGDADKVSTVFDQDFDFLMTPLAYDLRLTLTPAAGFVVTSVYGFPSWRSGSATVDLVIPTVFLSRNNGAVVVRLDPGNHKWPAGQSPLAALSLAYTSAVDGAKISDDLETSYTSSDPLGDNSIFYSQRAVRKSVSLVNQAVAQARACDTYWAGSRSEALALLERTRGMLLAESATLEDADLATEADNVLKLENNMRSGNSTSAKSDPNQEPPPMACSVALGSKAPTANLVILTMAVLGLALCRRRRRG